MTTFAESYAARRRERERKEAQEAYRQARREINAGLRPKTWAAEAILRNSSS